MNFLAHIYLSGGDEDIMVGNFIADWVKGAEYLDFPEKIQQGIMIHRNIDWFTDSHSITKQCKTLFNEKYRHYAGVVTDIIFDHYLAYDWNLFNNTPLNEYTEWVYETLLNHFDILPKGVQKYLPGFFANRWIEEYVSIGGIEKVLNGMSRTTSLPPETEWAIHVFKINYDLIKDQFYDFFPQITEFVQTKFQISIVQE